MKSVVSIIISVLSITNLAGQTITLDTAIHWSLKNNPAVKAAGQSTLRQSALNRAAFDIPKTDFSLLYGQYNSIHKKDNNITISQTLPFPSVLFRQKSLNEELREAAQINEQVIVNEVTYNVKMTFNHLLFVQARHRMLLTLDSLMRDLSRIIAIQYKTGEVNLLSKMSAETQLMEVQNRISRNEADMQIGLDKLQFLCRREMTGIKGSLDELPAKIDGQSVSSDRNPSAVLAAKQVLIAERTQKLEASRAMPDIRLGYFNQTLIGVQNVNGTDTNFGSSDRFQGFQVGLSVPVWFGPYRARSKAASFSKTIAEQERESRQIAIDQHLHQSQQELIKNENSLRYYRESALKTAELLKRQSHLSFRNGELDLKTHLLNLQQVLSIEEGYLQTLYEHNQNIITIEFLTGRN